MRFKMQPKTKKFIAALLALSMVGGSFLSFGKMDTNAQEQTLPGIEKLVSEYVASGDTFQILEIVPERKDANFGYLIGGQEPIYAGKKLSEMPSATERKLGFEELEENLDSLGELIGPYSMMTYEMYQEGTGNRRQEVRGQFVEGEGYYNYVHSPEVYRPLASGEVTDKQRFDRIFYCEEENDANQDKPSVWVTFTYIDTSNSSSNNLSMQWGTVSDGDMGYTNKRYNLQESTTVADVAGLGASFVPEDYVGQDVYINSSDTTYAYFGYVAWGEEVAELSGYTVQNEGTATDNNLSLYLVDPVTQNAYEWAVYNGGSYTFKTDYLVFAGAEFVTFSENSINGDFYISKAVDSEVGKYRLTEEYQASESGAYVVEAEAATSILYATDAGFDPTKTYDFVGDSRQDVLDTIVYDGGFYSDEWFKKHVLNLSGNSGYEKGSVSAGDMDPMNVEVKTLTVSEWMDIVNNDGYHGVNLDEVDFIYLSGQGDYINYGNGLEEAALWLVQKAYGASSVSERIPVIMDYQFYEKNKAVGNDVLVKMALVLLQVDNENMHQTVEGADASWWASLDTTALHETVNVQMADTVSLAAFEEVTLNQQEYLTESVYLNDDRYGALVAGDFLTDFTEESMTAKGHSVQNFGKVLEEIAYENFLQEKSARGTTGLLEEKVNKASIIRYILNWSAHRVTVKSSLKVLDLEPCYDFGADVALNEADVKKFMNQETYSGNIKITQMASAEFIGKIEDLNEQYDLIYVGARTGMMNTNSQGITMYNDAGMNGLIYTHTGDVFSYKKNEYNRVGSEDTTQRWRLRDDSIGYNDYYRAPGNDMNSTREEEFEQYIEAGYPVIFADELLLNIDGNVKVSNVTVDCNSYFDELIDFALSKDENGNYKYWQKNVYAESQLLATDGENENELAARQLRQNTFCKYLNISKLTINWVDNLGEDCMPIEYSEDGDFLRPHNGVYELKYIFSLANDSALSQVSTSYDCKLYVDNNSDGRFAGADYSVNQTNENSEELSGLTIYVRKNNAWEPLLPTTVGEETKYRLHTGYIYKVVRQLPEDYQGAIPWKLVFYDSEDRLVRTAKSGYTAVNRENSTESIRVLQLMSDKALSNGKERWNLEEDNEVQALLKEVPGFDIEIDSIYASTFIEDLVWWDNPRWTDEEFYRAYYEAAYATLTSYDMVILGFGDNYKFGATDRQEANMVVAEALRDYIEAGRSVLFTHDSSSYINTNASDASKNSWYWGYEFNKTMRAAVGLDRYGALQYYYAQMANAAKDGSFTRERYESYLEVLQSEYNYDNVYRPRSVIDATGYEGEEVLQVEGITKYTLVRYMYNQLEKFTGPNDMDYLFPIKNSVFYNAINKEANTSNMVDGQYSHGGNNMPMLKATQVNEGQITTYPFEIDEELLVESTHYQWLQPNMELDKDKDGKNDIVVWYTLSDVSSEAHSDNQKTNIYNTNPKDVVNNYYIYNMGNVTYSGAGHTKPETEMEKKLFVNTMVAAYSSGVKSPRVTVKNSINDNTDTFYMLYDPVNKMVLNGQEKIDVRFVAVDYNVLSGAPQIRIDIYKACNESNEEEGIYVSGIGEKVIPVDISDMNMRLVANGLGEGVANVQIEPVAVTDENSFEDYFKGVYYPVDNNMTYEISMSTKELGLFGKADGKMTLLGNAAADTFYIRATTVYDNGTKRTDSGVQKFQVSAAEIFDLK